MHVLIGKHFYGIAQQFLFLYFIVWTRSALRQEVFLQITKVVVFLPEVFVLFVLEFF
jgi:hypothetical protein